VTGVALKRRHPPWVRWSVAAAVGVLRALARTWRMREVNAAALAQVRGAGRPVVFAVWHGRLLPLMWHHRDQGLTVLVSPHADGDIGVQLAEAFGFRTERGSTFRGADRALMRMSGAAAEGREVVFTPDGPRGPAETFAPGALIVAQRSGAPLVPVTAGARAAWRLRSWDRFLIPKPFARVKVIYGDPIYVSDRTPREAAAQAEHAERILRDLTAAADA